MHRNTFLYIILLLLNLVILAPLNIYAQYSQLTGQVTDGVSGLEGVSIQLTGNSFIQGTLTDAEGKFQFQDVSAGTYFLKIHYVGFRKVEQEVVLQADRTINKEIVLEEDMLGLDEVVISATRYLQDRKNAPILVKTLNADLFEATQSVSLSDVLIFQPGVRVETNCQNCGFTQVRMNGLEGAYTQILINSRPLYTALTSVYGLDQIPINMIERVEVIKSGGSALFGSNGIAGTINIVTKEPIVNSGEFESQLGWIKGESLDQVYRFNTSIVGEEMQKGMNLYGMYRNREHFDANGDGFTELTDLENFSLGANAFYKPSEFQKIEVNLNGIYEFRRGGDRLNLPPQFTDITERLIHNILIGGLTYEKYAKNQNHTFSLYSSFQYTDRDSYYGGLGGGRTMEDSVLAANAYGNTSDFAIVNGSQFTRYFSENGILTSGIEWSHNNIRDETLGYQREIDQTVNNVGLYAQYEWKPISPLKLLLGARYENAFVDGRYQIGEIIRQANVHTQAFSPRITLLYSFAKDLQLRAGYARGFRAPQAFNEDFHISSVGGEPQFVILSETLNKEISDAFTASVTFSDDRGKVQSLVTIEAFYTSLNDPFTTVSAGAVLPNGSILEEVVNGSGAIVYGTNLDFQLFPFPNFQFQLGGTFQGTQYKESQLLFSLGNPTAEEPDIFTDELIRTPDVYAYMNISWELAQPFKIDMSGTYTGSMIVPRVVSESGFLELVNSPSFYDLNLKTSYNFSISSSLSMILEGGIQNILDSYQNDFEVGPERDSDYIYGPARPRTFIVGLSFKY